MAEDYIAAMSDWLNKHTNSENLVKKGYTSMESLAMLTGTDLGLTDINTSLTVRQTISQGQHEWLLKADPYAAMMGLLKQQVRSVLTDGGVQSSDGGPTPQPVPTTTPATSEASPWSWMDPQIHLKPESGKTQWFLSECN